MKKVVKPEQLKAHFKDGMTVMVGGFLGCGSPHRIIDELIQSGVKDLTIIANDTGFVDKGVGRLVVNGQVKRVIASHIGTNPETGRLMNEGKMEVELVPQGTLVEKIRAGGAGLGAVITPTGVGTIVEEGKNKITLNDVEYLIELPLKADLAILGGTMVDHFGNTFFRGTTKNFNIVMSTAADVVIVEADQLVDIGDINPDNIHTPGVLVDFIIEGGNEQ